MLIVKIKSDESIDKALKLFKSKVIKTKLIKELQNRKEYTKKSVDKRNKKLNAIYSQKIKNLE